ncbi:MAG: tetratricopeptide repeat protein [Pseudomonadota bacterium]|nr:tetratricopeptide repeat protein [Pseudomonadota bacterium]
MSLINDYLKKSRTPKKRSSSVSIEVPPVMRPAPKEGQTASSKERKFTPKTIILLVLIILLGGVAYYFTIPPAPPTYNNQFAQSDSAKVPLESSSIAGKRAGEKRSLKSVAKDAPVKPESRIGSVPVPGPKPSTLPEKQNLAVSDKLAAPGFSAKPESDSSADSVPVAPEPETVNSEPGSANISSVPIASRSSGEKVNKRAGARVRRPSRKDDIDHLFQVGVLALSSGNRSRAYYYFNQVLELNDQHQESLLNVAVILLQGNDFTKAQKLLVKAGRNDPLDARVKVNLGLIELKLENYENAQKLFAEALLLDPGARSALNNLAWLALQSGDRRAAAGYYRNLVALDPQNLKPLLAYASFCEQENSISQAVELYREALKSRFLENDRPLERRIRARIKLLTGYLE